MKYAVRTYRSFNDFKYGTFKYEINGIGEITIIGILKKTNNYSKYQETKRV
ncbi:MAG: hypothetical protein MUO82_10845 [Candidatus Thermoplasmatota archaeon]|nr:hypothetical protein [Candidatus Thermoplasmatota archaeon]